MKNKFNLVDKIIVSVLVCTEDLEKVWMYRNICFNINNQTDFKINLIINENTQSLRIVDGVIRNHIEILIIDEENSDELFEEVEKQIYKVCPETEWIVGTYTGYKYIYRINAHLKCIEHMQIRRNMFQEDMQSFIIYLLYKKKAERE